MNKKVLILGLTFLACCIIQAQSKDEIAIRNALTEQKDAWNAGNIDRYMKTYWRGDSLMFIGKNGITYGWQNTLNNYKKSYPDIASMGKLDFDILHVKQLSGIYFQVTGKWHLARSIGNLSGHFTLLFKKIKNKWVIIYDHSS